MNIPIDIFKCITILENSLLYAPIIKAKKINRSADTFEHSKSLNFTLNADKTAKKDDKKDKNITSIENSE